MGTKGPVADPPQGYVQRLTGVGAVLTSELTDIAYAGRGTRGSAYALVLCLVLAFAIATSSDPTSLVVGIPALVLLAIWVGARKG